MKKKWKKFLLIERHAFLYNSIRAQEDGLSVGSLIFLFPICSLNAEWSPKWLLKCSKAWLTSASVILGLLLLNYELDVDIDVVELELLQYNKYKGFNLLNEGIGSNLESLESCS